MTCTCGIIKVGGKPTESRNLDLDCPEHGTESDWWHSPEQVAKRAAYNERLRALQAEARVRVAEARRAVDKAEAEKQAPEIPTISRMKFLR